jgi:hypothetical protein
MQQEGIRLLRLTSKNLRKAHPKTMCQVPNLPWDSFASDKRKGTHAVQIVYRKTKFDYTNLVSLWLKDLRAWNLKKCDGAIYHKLWRVSTCSKLRQFGSRAAAILRQEITDIKDHWVRLANSFPQPEVVADCTTFVIDLLPCNTREIVRPEGKFARSMAPGSAMEFRDLAREFQTECRFARNRKDRWLLWAHEQWERTNWRLSLMRLGVPCRMISLDFETILTIRLKEPFAGKRAFAEWLRGFPDILNVWVIRPASAPLSLVGFNDPE